MSTISRSSDQGINSITQIIRAIQEYSSGIFQDSTVPSSSNLQKRVKLDEQYPHVITRLDRLIKGDGRESWNHFIQQVGRDDQVRSRCVDAGTEQDEWVVRGLD